MIETIINLSKKLIAVRSISENSEALAKVLDIALAQVSEYTIEKFEKNGVKSALIYNSTMRPEKFKILLNGHLDVIPGKEYQYIPKIVDNRLYGVGAMDMKANAACLIMAFKEVANRVSYPVGLQLVTDEEPGGFNGTKYQIDNGVRADFVISGESTNLNIVNKTKGIIWMKISTKGKSAHSAYPWKGENAIWEMNKFLRKIEKNYPIPRTEKWITTINLSRIETDNKTFNKIPDTCEVWFDIRYISEEKDKIMSTIINLLPEGFSFNIVENEPAVNVAENNQYIKQLQKIAQKITNKKVLLYGAQGSSDARHFSLVKCDGIEFGAIGDGIGSDEEWVSIPSLGTYTQILKKFLVNY